MVENRENFIPHVYLAPPNFVKVFYADKTKMIGLPYGEKNCYDMLSRFHLIPERNGRTDVRTDLLPYINIARQYADARLKLAAADLPRRPLADKFLHGAIEPANA